MPQLGGVRSETGCAATSRWRSKSLLFLVNGTKPSIALRHGYPSVGTGWSALTGVMHRVSRDNGEKSRGSLCPGFLLLTFYQDV